MMKGILGLILTVMLSIAYALARRFPDKLRWWHSLPCFATLGLWSTPPPPDAVLGLVAACVPILGVVTGFAVILAWRDARRPEVLCDAARALANTGGNLPLAAHRLRELERAPQEPSEGSSPDAKPR